MNPLQENDDTISAMMVLLDTTDSSDEIKCRFFLNQAGDIIKQIRQLPFIEEKYKLIQIQIAIELFNKQGVEGQTSHSENGISRSYEKGYISSSLISQITPRANTPFSKVYNTGVIQPRGDL